MRLFCLTYAGGSASFFDLLRQGVNPDVKLTGLEYAGHGERRKEKFYQDFTELAEDLYPRIKETLYNSYGLKIDETGISEAEEYGRKISVDRGRNR